MYNCHSCVFTTLLVEVGVVYGRLNKGTECVKECGIFKFECRGVFLVVLRVFFVVCRSHIWGDTSGD